MEQLISQMHQHGYVIFRSFLPSEGLANLETEFRGLVARHYRPENLLAHSVYPADQSENRESHAMMIAEGPSELPAVAHEGCHLVEYFLQWHNQMIAALTGIPVDSGARSLLNWQEYRSGSKPVGEHIDGEYMRAAKQDSVEFTLLEGILPRYVCVLVLKNENSGKGVELLRNGEVLSLLLHPGDLVLFDNVRLRHRVPELAHPRTTIGLRNFDHQALHFVRNRNEGVEGRSYREIAEGFVSEEVDCQQRFKKFLQQEWLLIRDSYGAYV
jgi:hypothetical protein